MALKNTFYHEIVNTEGLIIKHKEGVQGINMHALTAIRYKNRLREKKDKQFLIKK